MSYIDAYLQIYMQLYIYTHNVSTYVHICPCMQHAHIYIYALNDVCEQRVTYITSIPTHVCEHIVQDIAISRFIYIHIYTQI